jgi:hypothetical protein
MNIHSATVRGTGFPSSRQPSSGMKGPLFCSIIPFIFACTPSGSGISLPRHTPDCLSSDVVGETIETFVIFVFNRVNSLLLDVVDSGSCDVKLRTAVFPE